MQQAGVRGYVSTIVPGTYHGSEDQLGDRGAQKDLIDLHAAVLKIANRGEEAPWPVISKEPYGATQGWTHGGGYPRPTDNNGASPELSNVEFHCGRAEDLVPTLVSRLASQQLVAILDPPRAGLHSKVILAIRRAENLKRLLYVSCNPRAAMGNFVDLCRAPSNRVKGTPFRPVKAVAVDLFPQTPHCEMLILFERGEYPNGTGALEHQGPLAQPSSQEPPNDTALEVGVSLSS